MSAQIDDDHVMNDLYQIERTFDKSRSNETRICCKSIITVLFNNFHEISSNINFKSEIKKISKNVFALF